MAKRPPIKFHCQAMGKEIFMLACKVKRLRLSKGEIDFTNKQCMGCEQWPAEIERLERMAKGEEPATTPGAQKQCFSESPVQVQGQPEKRENSPMPRSEAGVSVGASKSVSMLSEEERAELVGMAPTPESIAGACIPARCMGKSDIIRQQAEKARLEGKNVIVVSPKGPIPDFKPDASHISADPFADLEFKPFEASRTEGLPLIGCDGVRLKINSSAYKLMGKPAYVVLHVSVGGKALGLKPADKVQPGSFKVNDKSKSYGMRCQTLAKKLGKFNGVELVRSETHGMWCAKLPEGK